MRSVRYCPISIWLVLGALLCIAACGDVGRTGFGAVSKEILFRIPTGHRPGQLPYREPSGGWPQGERAWGMAVTDDAIYIGELSERNGIQKFDRRGNFLRMITGPDGCKELASPGSLCAMEGRLLFVTRCKSGDSARLPLLYDEKTGRTQVIIAEGLPEGWTESVGNVIPRNGRFWLSPGGYATYQDPVGQAAARCFEFDEQGKWVATHPSAYRSGPDYIILRWRERDSRGDDRYGVELVAPSGEVVWRHSVRERDWVYPRLYHYLDGTDVLGVTGRGEAKGTEILYTVTRDGLRPRAKVPSTLFYRGGDARAATSNGEVYYVEYSATEKKYLVIREKYDLAALEVGPAE